MLRPVHERIGARQHGLGQNQIQPPFLILLDERGAQPEADLQLQFGMLVAYRLEDAFQKGLRELRLRADPDPGVGRRIGNLSHRLVVQLQNSARIAKKHPPLLRRQGNLAVPQQQGMA